MLVLVLYSPKCKMALVNYSWHFRHYLYGRKFIARTDHDALRWLTNFKEPSGQIARWLERLAEFDLKVHARPGKRHGNADGLSRRPPDVDGVRSELPAVGTITKGDSSNWCRKWSPTELRHVQMKDPTVGPVLVWREQKSEPPTQNDLQAGPSVRKLCSHWDSLKVQDGVLYRRWEDDNGASTRLLLVVPRALVPEVLSACHNSPTAGHLGVTKTVGKFGSASTGQASIVMWKTGFNAANGAPPGRRVKPVLEPFWSAVYRVTP